MVLQDTVERIYDNKQQYGEIRRGVYIVRGENVALLGEIDVEKEERMEEQGLPGSLSQLTQIPFEEMENTKKAELEEGKKKERITSKKMSAHGFNLESFMDNLY